VSVPRFEPFAGVRYRDDLDLAKVASPPFDVVSSAEREELGARSPFNAVHIDLPRDTPDTDRYHAAAHLLHDWIDRGVLVRDDEPCFYVYRMGFRDESGHAHQTAGVIGALELVDAGKGDVLPHEQTTPKDRTDRLSLIRACHANLSPVWGLSLTSGLSGLFDLSRPPDARFTDDAGVHHRLYRVTEAGVASAIADAVESSPVMIADGHHRYSVSRDYRDECRAARGGAAGPYDLAMAFVVELVAEQLHVQPIHRLLSGPITAGDVGSALGGYFDAFDAGPLDGAATITTRMQDAGALALVTPKGFTLLRPREGALDGVPELDTARLDAALAASGRSYELAFLHGVDNIVGAVRAGHSPAGVLLRPATVAQIAATAQARALMPPKTTFFAPKPKTGVVFRLL